MTRLVDLSHVIEPGLQTYPGFPPPVFGEYLSREASRPRFAPGTEFQIGSIQMIGNTGTYVDAPFHRFDGGTDLSGLPLERLAGCPGVKIQVSGRRAGRTAFEGVEVSGRAVLVETGFSRHWATPLYFESNPFVDREAAQYLADHGAAIVGIDSMNIDDTGDPERPAHTILLRAGIPVVEHLTNLSAVPQSGFRFFAVPPRVRGFGTFPVRAFAMVE